MSLINILRVSSFYETEPVGYNSQPWFINIAISGYTELDRFSLFDQLKNIEYLLGRKTRERWHEREIDIDILILGELIQDNPELTLPHPRMQERRFVLAPAAEIAGNHIHPVLKLSINEILKMCKDRSIVKLKIAS